MKYELTGRIVFEADDVQDAFQKLSRHFKALAQGTESALPLGGTDVKIRKIGTRTPLPPAPPSRRTRRPER